MFPIVDELAYRIAACKNPHMFWGDAKEIPEAERNAEIAILTKQFEDVIIFIRLMEK